MKIVIGCDNLAVGLKEKIKKHLEEKGVDFVDIGVKEDETTDYPEIALEAAERVASNEFDRGILICGTGLGMAIAANKVPGVRAATVADVYSAERAMKSNNAQIITMGTLTVGPELAKMLVDAWLNSEFQGGRSLPKVEKINNIDTKYRKEFVS